MRIEQLLPIGFIAVLSVLAVKAMWECRRRQLPQRDETSLNWGDPVGDPDSAIGAGWWLELEGERIAELTEPRHHVGEFWFSYRVVPITQNPAMLNRLYSKEDWDKCVFKFRSRQFGVLAPNAFAGHPPSRETDRIWVRGLHIQIDSGSSIVEKMAGAFGPHKKGKA